MGNRQIYSSCSPLVTGCTVYTDNRLITPLINTYFSDGEYSYQVDGSGIIIDITNCSAPSGFTTEWNVSGDATARTITLPLVNSSHEGSLSYNCVIDWGDGTSKSVVTGYTDSRRIHTYSSNGTYDVVLTGTCEGWSFNNTGDKLKIRKVKSWGHSPLFNGFKYLKSGFYGCTNLTELPPYEKIPASGSGIQYDSFTLTFEKCSSLTSIPSGLFDDHPNNLLFNSTFFGCTGITSIPSGLFEYNTLVIQMIGTFENCRMTSIPNDLFKYNTLITHVDSTFNDCSSLTSIPSGLFEYNINILSFSRAFIGCKSLSSIPSGLFDYNISAKDFTYTFDNCTSITSIPSGLFDNTSKSAVFNGAFAYCTSLTSAPSGLFDGTTSGSTFSEIFCDCTSLQTIPSNFFRYTQSTVFSVAFSGCTSLQLRSDIFCDESTEMSTRFLNTSPNFYECFSRPGNPSPQGTAPQLWNYSYGSGTPTTYKCFYGLGNSSTSLSNYSDIPVAWRT